MAFAAPVAAALTSKAGLIALTIGSKVVGTIIEMRGAKAQAKSLEAIYKYNASVKEREAAQIRRANLEEQAVRREQMWRFIKTRRAAYAKGGVVMEGSPMEAQLQAVSDISDDIDRMSLSYEIAAKRATSEAGLEIYKAKAARQAGKISVGTALFGGLSDLAMMGLNYQLQKQQFSSLTNSQTASYEREMSLNK